MVVYYILHCKTKHVVSHWEMLIDGVKKTLRSIFSQLIIHGSGRGR